MKSKSKVSAIVPCVVIIMMVVLCGCSATKQEEIIKAVATAVAEAMKPTPTPTAAPVPTFEPTVAPIATATATPQVTPEVEAKPRPGSENAPGCNLFFARRKQATHLLVTWSENQKLFKVVLPPPCGSPKVTAFNEAGKAFDAPFSGIANESRSHHNISRALRKMPHRLQVGSRSIIMPARCLNKLRCE